MATGVTPAPRAEPAAVRTVPPAPFKPTVFSSGAGPETPAKGHTSDSPRAAGNLKDVLVTEVRKSNPVLYNTLIAQAQRLEVLPDRVVLAFTAEKKIGPTFDKYRPALEALATRLAGRKMIVVSETVDAAATPSAAAKAAGEAEKKSALKEQAMADAGVQALLEVFPAEIRDVEEM